MALLIRDVEELKKRARRLAAAQVLTGGGADLSLALGDVGGSQVSVAAGYGALTQQTEVVSGDRLLWILDGHVEIHEASGASTTLSQGESAVLAAGKAYRLVFPTLTIYLRVDSRGEADGRRGP